MGCRANGMQGWGVEMQKAGVCVLERKRRTFQSSGDGGFGCCWGGCVGCVCLLVVR